MVQHPFDVQGHRLLRRQLNDHPVSSGRTVVSTSRPPAVAGFLDQDYRHKSVAIQIPQGAYLALNIIYVN